MRPFRTSRWVCALVLVGIGSTPARAGWDNVFEVTCFGCKPKPAVSSYGGCPTTACAPPCPQPTCTTQYVQRSYYQPVTSYQAQTYYEPVTNYRTSYYYEPVTSYRYSCYYDPCSCSYQQVATPQTCYRLRSQTCAVTNYLQRTCQVPVTSYQLSYYYEPVTTCCQPSCNSCSPCSCPSPCPATPAVTEQPSPTYAPPATQPPPTTQPPPAVRESPSIPPTSATPSDSGYQRISPSATPPATNTPPTGRVVQPPAAAPAVAPVPPPAVKLDRIVSLPAHNAVQGVVVQADDKPRPSAKLLFVNDKKLGTQQPVTADPAGKFNVDLAPGTWLIYLAGTDGKLIYHSKLDVQGEGNRPVMLVSR